VSLVSEPSEPDVAATPRIEILFDGRLAGIASEVLAERFGTPAFVYDLGVVGRRTALLRDALRGRLDLAYAVKANPNLAVLRHLAGLGLGADVASGAELRHALRAGFDADAVVMTGPGKRDEELVAAVDAGRVVVSARVGRHHVLGLPAEQPRVETGSRRRVGLVGVDPARHPGRIILTVLMTAGYSRCHRAFPRPGPVGRGDGDRLVVAAACGGRAGDGRGAVAVVGEGHPGGSAAGYLIGRPVVGWGARRRVRRRDGADISRWYGLSACIADGEVLRVHFLVTGLSARLRGQR